MSDQARDRMRQRMERTAPVARKSGENVASAAGESAPTRKVRITVDLGQPQYEALKAYAAAHVTDGSKVVRALLDELAADEALAAAVAERLRD